MTRKLQIYKCDICGNVVEVLHTGEESLVCCGQPMKLQEEKVQEQGNEKHLPVVDVKDGKVRVKVGSVAHPMQDEHLIEWIEVITEDGVYRKFLSPGAAPEAEFSVEGRVLEVRSYCNLHGLWSRKL